VVTGTVVTGTVVTGTVVTGTVVTGTVVTGTTTVVAGKAEAVTGNEHGTVSVGVATRDHFG